ncbi:MAG: hypothetical protein ACI9OE_002258 [Mariniflexile sp.]|jgi:hypothetical protein
MPEIKNGFASIHLIPYKHSAAKGLSGHIHRSFKKNKNTFEHLSHQNFGGSLNTYDKYQSLYKKHKEVLGRSPQKNANTYIDAVLELSLDRFEQLENEYTQDELKTLLTTSINQLMKDISVEFSLHPVNFKFHLDEGLIDPKTQKLKRNPHAHLIFYNYDFKNKTSPLRKLRRSDMSIFQDLCFLNFKNIGFRRGISAIETKKKHLIKDKFIAEKQQEKVAAFNNKLFGFRTKLENQQSQIGNNKQILMEQHQKVNELTAKCHELSEEKIELIRVLIKLKKRISEFKTSATNWISSLLNNTSSKLTRERAITELLAINSINSSVVDEVTEQIQIFEKKADLKDKDKITKEFNKRKMK